MSNTVKIRITILLLFTWFLFYIPGYTDEPVSSQDSALSKEESTISFEVSDVDGDTIEWKVSIVGTPPRGHILGPKEGEIPGGSGSAEVTYVAPKKRTLSCYYHGQLK